jgi:hypothetical protein
MPEIPEDLCHLAFRFVIHSAWSRLRSGRRVRWGRPVGWTRDERRSYRAAQPLSVLAVGRSASTGQLVGRWQAQCCSKDWPARTRLALSRVGRGPVGPVVVAVLSWRAPEPAIWAGEILM